MPHTPVTKYFFSAERILGEHRTVTNVFLQAMMNGPSGKDVDVCINFGRARWTSDTFMVSLQKDDVYCVVVSSIPDTRRTLLYMAVILPDGSDFIRPVIHDEKADDVTVITADTHLVGVEERRIMTTVPRRSFEVFFPPSEWDRQDGDESSQQRRLDILRRRTTLCR